MFIPLNAGARALCALALFACFIGLPQRSAVAQSPNNQIAFHSDRDGDWDIYVMNADGSGQRALTNNTLEDRDPVWSPDGRTIAFQSRLGPNNIEIFLVNADGSRLRNLTNHPAAEFQPAFSPDGKHLAFVSNRDKQSDIYVIDVDGKNPRRFSNNESDEWRPMWSPDGKEIAYVSGRDAGQSDGSGELYVRDARGAAPDRRLIKESRRVLFFSWSPDSARLAYFMVAARKFEIGVADRTGANEKNLSAVAPSSMDSEPVWSPDGRQIAFLGGTATGTMGVFVMAADGTARRMISAADTPATGPLSWAPDSSGVVHVETLNGNFEVVFSRTDGGTFSRLTNNPAADQAASFAWSPRARQQNPKSAVIR